MELQFLLGVLVNHFTVLYHRFYNVHAGMVGQEFVGRILENHQVGLFTGFQGTNPVRPVYGSRPVQVRAVMASSALIPM